MILNVKGWLNRRNGWVTSESRIGRWTTTETIQTDEGGALVEQRDVPALFCLQRRGSDESRLWVYLTDGREIILPAGFWHKLTKGVE
jgi:hypothetical protein